MPNLQYAQTFNRLNKQMKTEIEVFSDELKSFLENEPTIQAATLYGSYARGTQKPQSDIDVAIWVTAPFNPEDFEAKLKEKFGTKARYIFHTRLRKNFVLHDDSFPSVEIKYFVNPEDFAYLYISWEMPPDKNPILFDKTGKFSAILNDFSQKRAHERLDGKLSDVLNAIQKFKYEFEKASCAHKKSEANHAYFFYNIAFHEAVKLRYWAASKNKNSYLPKNLTTEIFTLEENEIFYQLNGTLYLPEWNKKKRALLSFFYETIDKLAIADAVKEDARDFCEWVYKRDFFWNFRDVSKFNPNIKAGRVFRSSALSVYQHEPFFENLRKTHSFGVLIDFRDDHELAKAPYQTETLSQIRHVHCPIAPQNQDEAFRAQHVYGTNVEIAYRYFVYCAKDAYKKAILALLTELAEEKSAVVHCKAGKDRTGCFISLLHLLTEAPLEALQADYLASEMDTDAQILAIFLSGVEARGGVTAYLIDCGLSTEEIDRLKTFLTV